MFLTDGYQAPVGDATAYPRDIAPAPWHIGLGYAIWYMLMDVQASIHTGIDLSMEPNGGLGQPVYAVANGVVSFARDVTGSSWRNLLVIEHHDPDGTTRCSRYGHLLAFAPGIAPGAWIRRGQMVGWVGNSFGLFYAHLHFDLAKGTLLINLATNWPGDNLRYVLDNYYNPEVVIRDNYPMAVSTLSQIKNLALQIAALCDAAEPVPPPLPNPYPDPDPASIIVVVKENSTNIRVGPSTNALVLAIVNAGDELHVLDAHVTANGYSWYKVSGGKYDGGFIAQSVVRPKV